jgi:hypothetical protein
MRISWIYCVKQNFYITGLNNSVFPVVTFVQIFSLSVESSLVSFPCYSQHLPKNEEFSPINHYSCFTIHCSVMRHIVGQKYYVNLVEC